MGRAERARGALLARLLVIRSAVHSLVIGRADAVIGYQLIVLGDAIPEIGTDI